MKRRNNQLVDVTICSPPAPNSIQMFPKTHTYICRAAIRDEDASVDSRTAPEVGSFPRNSDQMITVICLKRPRAEIPPPDPHL